MSMFPIASAITTAGGFTDFNNIPQTFTHLQIRVSGASAYTPGTGYIETWIGLNNQAGTTVTAGYTHRLFGDGSTVYSSSSAQTNLLSTPWLPYGLADTFIGSYVIDILDYTNTNKFKTIKAFGGYDANGSGLVTLHSGYSNITAAVQQVRVATNSGNFKAGGRIDLYGISTSSATGV
jgi:hypothetical protein